MYVCLCVSTGGGNTVIAVNAARYEYKSSSDSEKLYLSARRPHRRSVEHKTETSSESEDEEDDDECSDKNNSPDQKVMATCSNPKAVTPNSRELTETATLRELHCDQ
jgi:hypothetical protein